MRILDRQRYWAFLKAYAICFTALVGLYVVIDAFSNFDEFTKRASGAVEIFQVMARYYLVHMSEMYDRLCGVIGMMAAIFTVTWMQRNNELLAMLAAGVSTQRVIRPVLVCSAMVSTIAVANQECVMPELAEELMKSHDDDGSQKVKPSSRTDSNHIYMHGVEADRGAQTIVKFYATVPVEVFGELHELEAKQALYVPESASHKPYRGGWLLRGVSPPLDDEHLKQDVIVKVDPAEAGAYPPPVGDLTDLGGETYFLRTNLTFQAMTRRRQWYQYARTPDLIRALDDPANDSEKLNIGVFLHGRLLRPVLGLALLFVSLPQVLGGYGRNMFVNLGLSLGVAAMFYGANFLCQYLGTNEVVSPELAAWLPLIAFGTFAAHRWGAIRT